MLVFSMAFVDTNRIGDSIYLTLFTVILLMILRAPTSPPPLLGATVAEYVSLEIGLTVLFSAVTSDLYFYW